MKLLDKLLGRTETRSADPSWQHMQERGTLSAAGQHVDGKSAEGISAVYASVQSLSESTACLPLHVYSRTDDGRERADNHPLARVLREPNPYQSGMAFRESMTASVLMAGNGYARKDIDGSGEVAALYPLNALSVEVLRLASGRYAYDWTDTDGKRIRLLQDEVFHLRDRCDAGSHVGKSRITIARETLGLNLALRAHGAATFRNGTRLSGVLETDRQLSSEQTNSLHEGWKKYVGMEGAGKTFIAPNGVKYRELSMTLEDAEWIAAQQFNVEEVARIFRVPPTMIGDLRHGNYSNTVELSTQFIKYSLQRWLHMWESEISRSLLPDRQHFAEHSVEGLLRGNPEARADFYGKAIKDGWMQVAEVRRLENLPALPVDEQQSSPVAL